MVPDEHAVEVPSAPETASGKACYTAARDGAKTRACLRCHQRFESDWSGERICRRCKGSTTWQNGEPYRRNRASRANPNWSKSDSA